MTDIKNLIQVSFLDDGVSVCMCDCAVYLLIYVLIIKILFFSGCGLTAKRWREYT